VQVGTECRCGDGGALLGSQMYLIAKGAIVEATIRSVEERERVAVERELIAEERERIAEEREAALADERE
jgi:hypothetical protein